MVSRRCSSPSGACTQARLLLIHLTIAFARRHPAIIGLRTEDHPRFRFVAVEAHLTG